MKIDNSINSVNSSPVQPETGRPAREPATEGETSRPSTAVKLSSLSSQLQMIEKGFADTPVVDAARVAEIKQAIAEGRFKVNAEAVADRLIETAREMIRANKA